MMPSVALIDYGSGNLRSAAKALERAGLDSKREAVIAVTSDPNRVRQAQRVVLPGVGAFGDCMRGLTSIAGMRDALEEAVLKRGVPFLGICVGMQLLATTGREFGTHAGLDWIEGEVTPLAPGDPALKIPHMGWNAISIVRPHPLFAGIATGSQVYFVHSYAMRPRDSDHVLATADHGGAFAAAVARDNIAGVQFHPEKSQASGLALLANFLSWRP